MNVKASWLKLRVVISMTTQHESVPNEINPLGSNSPALSADKWPVLRQQVVEEAPTAVYAGWKSFTVVDAIEDLASSSLELWAAAKGGVIQLRSKDDAIRVWRHSSEHGLPGSHFNLVVIDPYERPWIRSSQGYIYYLSGDAWCRMSEGSGLPSGRVLCARSDKERNLWIGTDRGLGHFEFDNETNPVWHPYNLSKLHLPSPEILSVDVSSSGQLAAGTPWGLYVQGEHKEWSRYATLDGLPSVEVAHVAFFNDEDLWIGTAAGLGSLTDGLSSYSQVLEEPIKRIVRSRDGSEFWFVTNASLWVYRGGSLERVSLPPTFSASTRPTSISVNRKGSVYVGFDRGLAEYHPARRVILEDSRDSVASEPVDSLIVDQKGQVWAGSASGLRLLRKDRWRFFARPSSSVTPIRNISDAQIDATGAIWVGSWEGGRWGGLRVTRNYLSLHKAPGSVAPETVDAILATGDGFVYVASGSRILQYDGHDWSLVAESPEPSAIISSLLVVDNTLWCGCSSGLFRRPSDSGKPSDSWHAANNAAVNGLAADSGGTIWVAAEDGLLMIKDGASSRQALSLGSSQINVVLATEPYGIWLGTNSGLALLNGDGELYKWDVFTSGLPHDRVIALAVDEASKRLWIGTGNGIAALSLENMALAG